MRIPYGVFGFGRGQVDACNGCWAECEVVLGALYTGDVVRGMR